jgi:hypothetical protein
LSAGGVDACRVTPADRVHLDIRFEGKEMRGLSPRIRVSFAHESIANHADPECLCHKLKYVLN